MDTNRYLKAVNIEWDVDLAEDLDSLPKEVQIPDGMTDTEEISDYLSNLTGFCHRGFGPLWAANQDPPPSPHPTRC